MPTLTPKQKTAFRDMLRAEIPHLVGELGLNGTQCYNYLKAHHGGYIPVIRETVCRWVVKHRGTPGKSGRPATSKKTAGAMNAAETEPTIVKKECVILNRHHTRPVGTHPALLRTKRMFDRAKPLAQEGKGSFGLW